MSVARGHGPSRTTLIVSGIAVVIAAVAALSLSPRHVAPTSPLEPASQPTVAPASDTEDGDAASPPAAADRVAPIAAAAPAPPATVADLAPTTAAAKDTTADADASSDDAAASAPKLSAEEQSLADAVGDTRHADGPEAGGNTSE